MPFIMYGVFSFATFVKSYAYKFIVPEAYFHAKSISASPIVNAHKTVKLFKFLDLPTQHDPTIVLMGISFLGLDCWALL